jgi:hypothetical protein
MSGTARLRIRVGCLVEDVSRVFVHVGVDRAQYMEGSMANSTAMSTPQEDVDALITVRRAAWAQPMVEEGFPCSPWRRGCGSKRRRSMGWRWAVCWTMRGRSGPGPLLLVSVEMRWLGGARTSRTDHINICRCSRAGAAEGGRSGGALRPAPKVRLKGFPSVTASALS